MIFVKIIWQRCERQETGVCVVLCCVFLCKRSVWGERESVVRVSNICIPTCTVHRCKSMGVFAIAFFVFCRTWLWTCAWLGARERDEETRIVWIPTVCGVEVCKCMVVRACEGVLVCVYFLSCGWKKGFRNQCVVWCVVGVYIQVFVTCTGQELYYFF